MTRIPAQRYEQPIPAMLGAVVITGHDRRGVLVWELTDSGRAYLTALAASAREPWLRSVARTMTDSASALSPRAWILLLIQARTWRGTWSDLVAQIARDQHDLACLERGEWVPFVG